MADENTKFKRKLTLRVLHRYVGFFMVGLVIFYALSGTLLLLRDTPVLKKDIPVDVTIATNLNKAQFITKVRLNKKYNFRDLKVIKVQNGIITFAKNRYNSQGTYNSKTGELKYTQKKYPKFISKLLDLHKNKISNPTSFINLSFILALLFFVVTSFFMYEPRSKIFKRGMAFVIAGLIFAIVAVLI